MHLEAQLAQGEQARSLVITPAIARLHLEAQGEQATLLLLTTYYLLPLPLLPLLLTTTTTTYYYYLLLLLLLTTATTYRVGEPEE